MTNKELLGEIIQRLNSWKSGYISKQTYLWTEKDEQAFQAIKSLLSEPTDEEREEMVNWLNIWNCNCGKKDICRDPRNPDMTIRATCIHMYQKIHSLILSSGKKKVSREAFKKFYSASFGNNEEHVKEALLSELGIEIE